MPAYHYSAMNRVPESEKVRIGYRYRDFLEMYGCRSCSQKFLMTCVPFMASYVYFREYQIKFGHFPLLRASAVLGRLGLKQQVLFLLPIVNFCIGGWWAELTYNRCVLGIQGAEPMPDEIIKRY